MSSPINLNKKTYRPDEVAQILSLTRRTVYRMIRDGRLPSVRFGSGPWRIPRETLLPLLSPEGHQYSGSGQLNQAKPEWSQTTPTKSELKDLLI